VSEVNTIVVSAEGVLVPTGLPERFPHLKRFWPLQLKEILLAFLIDEREAHDLLENRFGPLSSLSARTDAAYILGLISADEHHDLTLVRRIRNAFAHDYQIDFTTPSVKDRCAELRLAAGYHDTPPRLAPGQFLKTVVALMLRFTNRPFYVAQERRTSKDWPYDGTVG
jgi:mannitol operon repressor